MRSRPFSMLMELMIARPGYVSSAALQRVGLERVDHQRRLDAHREQLVDDRHLLGLVAALGERDADVEHVRAGLDLLARDLEHAVVVVGEQELLDLARALRVHALADEQRARLLVQRRRPHARRRSPAGTRGAAACARAAADGLAQLADVLRRRAAAAADHVRAPVVHERRHLLGHLGRAERVDGLAVDVQRQAGVRDHRRPAGRTPGTGSAPARAGARARRSS